MFQRIDFYKSVLPAQEFLRPPITNANSIRCPSNDMEMLTPVLTPDFLHSNIVEPFLGMRTRRAPDGSVYVNNELADPLNPESEVLSGFFPGVGFIPIRERDPIGPIESQFAKC